MVRSEEHVEGLPKLSHGSKEEVRKANVLVARTARACDLIADQGGGFAVENPAPREGKPSLFKMPAIVALQKKHSARSVEFDQCRYGAPTTKPTRVLWHRGGFVTLHKECDHPPRWQEGPRGRTISRSWSWAPHPPLWGQKKDGVWRAKLAAQYPPALCRELARCIAVTQPLVAADRAASGPTSGRSE